MKGDLGSAGKNGIKGDKGETGVTGRVGSDGSKGDKGDKGKDVDPQTLSDLQARITALEKYARDQPPQWQNQSGLLAVIAPGAKQLIILQATVLLNLSSLVLACLVILSIRVCM